ncbi:MAG: c-type cytochrome biogenesis protein CcmI [Halieaceae bacterium]|nr:c-type cytochrome biogenesis protein CcmI [Halieaceae bacterium]
MSFFVAGAVLLFLIAAGLLLWRRDAGPRAADGDDPNLAWYRTREAELDDGDETLVEEARLRLLEDGVSGEASAQQVERPGRLPVAVMLALLFAVSALVYWQTGAIEDVLIYRELGEISPEDGEAARLALLERIQRRSDARPDNLQYHNLLGRLYLAGEDFPAASVAFERLVERAPQDPEALAMAAQARFLTSGRELDPQAQLYAERALAANPEQRTALGLLGMASFESGVYPAAIAYWERLRALEDRGSPGYEMLGEVIALARERSVGASDDAGDSVSTAVEAQAGEADDAAPGISVALRLSDSAAADPGATIFVFARPEGSGGMPVAVRRLQADDLPVTLRLTDRDAMAGQRLSEAGRVVVTAQLSANGQPGEANALFSGASSPVTAGGAESAVTIELGTGAERG